MKFPFLILLFSSFIFHSCHMDKSIVIIENESDHPSELSSTTIPLKDIPVSKVTWKNFRIYLLRQDTATAFPEKVKILEKDIIFMMILP